MGHLLCIAIAIPEPWGSTIDDARRRLQPGRRHMAAHITIIPPFRVTDEALGPLLGEVVHDISACEPFTIELRGTAVFDETSTTVFLPVVEGSQGCISLRERLGAHAGQQAHADAPRHPMVPHVTIVNRADAALMERAAAEFAEFGARFEVDRGCVYEFGADGWTILRAADFLGTRA